MKGLAASGQAKADRLEKPRRTHKLRFWHGFSGYYLPGNEFADAAGHLKPSRGKATGQVNTGQLR
jgi:hypothetical protein